MRKLAEPVRQAATVLQDDATVRREARHLDQIAVPQTGGLKIGAQEQPVADRDGDFAGQPNIETAGAPRIDPAFVAVRFAHDQMPVFAPQHRDGIVF